MFQFYIDDEIMGISSLRHYMVEYLEYLTECLQSSISYGGGKCLKDLYSVRWI